MIVRALSPKNLEHRRRLAKRAIAPAHAELPPLPAGPYDIVYADPPKSPARLYSLDSNQRKDFWVNC